MKSQKEKRKFLIFFVAIYLEEHSIKKKTKSLNIFKHRHLIKERKKTIIIEMNRTENDRDRDREKMRKKKATTTK